MSKLVNGFHIAVLLLGALPSGFDFNHLANSTKKEIPELGGSFPMMLPYNEGDPLPPEMPRFIFQQSNFNVQASSSRLDFDFVVEGQDKEPFIININDRMNNISKILKTISLDLPYRIGVALNVVFDKEGIMDSLARFIDAEKIIQSKQEIQFGYLDKSSVRYLGDSFEVNIWKRYNYNCTLNTYNCLLDINTPLEHPLSLKNDDCENVYREVIKNEAEVTFCDC